VKISSPNNLCLIKKAYKKCGCGGWWELGERRRFWEEALDLQTLGKPENLRAVLTGLVEHL
jgi:hypothetical protein